MPEIIIVAGPNGAGKTSFARAFLPTQLERFKYINADEIEKELAANGYGGPSPEIHAGRLMLRRVDYAVANLSNIMLETTLATRNYVRNIHGWRRKGYSIGLIYLRLSNVDHAIMRVKRRVAEGGHNIPEAVIRRRFSTSLSYLELLYKPIVDEWYVWESVEGDFIPAESWNST